MSFRTGILGKKLGMTQVFTTTGDRAAVTAIHAGPCVVIDKLTPEKNGYAAVKLGIGQKPLRVCTKPEIGVVKKTGLVSLRTDEIALPNIEGVRVAQGFWGRIWGYGHLRIEGTGVDAVQLPTIADPVSFRRAIETAKGIK